MIGRYEIVDMTTPEGDPRFVLWDAVDRGYVPGYWPSRERAEAAARHMAADDKTVR